MKRICMALMAVLCFSCGGPEPRKPIQAKSGSFMEASVERNKALLAEEEQQLVRFMAQDSSKQYHETSFGSFYYYDRQNPEATYTPQPDDLVTLTYNLRSLEQDTIYDEEEIGVLTYKVDKEEYFPGLRHSVKLLKEGEKATFLYPSALGYGYHGDNNKIGINVPLQASISILSITPAQDSIDQN